MSNQTGPTTFSGKLASRMNNLRHGGTAKSLFLASENPEDFFKLLTDFFEQYQPSFDHDAALVTRAVRDHWILLRRERTADAFEKALHDRKPDPTNWVASELNEIHLFDRYKTEASRACNRSLKNLQIIQKMARDEQKWQLHLAKQKETFAPDLERWQAQQQSNQPDEPAPPPEPAIKQTVYIGLENGRSRHYETTPTNAQLRPRLLPTDQITRVYNFVGGVPPQYQHLITPDAYRHGSSTSVQKIYTYQEWNTLVAAE